MSGTAKDMIRTMTSWLGYSESNGKFKQILDIYNNHKPLARGYAIRTSDEWCAATISAAAIQSGCVDALGGTEVSCNAFIRIFKNKGIWLEDGSIKPKAGYIVLYNWDDGTQPNDGEADHIGLVVSVSGSTVTAIEGNRHERVAYRTFPIGWGYVRGYAAPKYGEAKTQTTTTVKKTTTTTSKPVAKTNKIAEDGDWGKATTLLAQKVFGTTQDGIISSQPIDYKKYLPNVYAIEYVSFRNADGSQLITAIQRKIGATADGFFGRKSILAFQKWLGVKQDCSVGPDTVKAFQKWLNARV